jgi:hypothetical protein
MHGRRMTHLAGLGFMPIRGKIGGGGWLKEDGMTVPENMFPIVKMRDLPPHDGGEAPGRVCIPNINAEERRKRLIPGIIGMVLTLVILGVMMTTGIDRLWRIVLFFLFAGSASGYFQARDYT